MRSWDWPDWSVPDAPNWRGRSLAPIASAGVTCAYWAVSFRDRPDVSVGAGVGLVPENRKARGPRAGPFGPRQSARRRTASAVSRTLVSFRRAADVVGDLIARLQIATPSPHPTGQVPERRQSAEGRHRQVAQCRFAVLHFRRADTRASTSAPRPRSIRLARGAGRTGRRRADDQLGADRDCRRLRPRLCHARQDDRRRARARSQLTEENILRLAMHHGRATGSRR